MSECVVRMEMPESCEKCPACDYEEGNCLLADDRNTLPHNGKRRSWCPIVCALPENHGRLVDIDRKFLRVANNGHGMSWNWRGSIADMIDKDNMRGVEIIVPAERSET